jgi:alkanesulfonate monooxygenase
MNVEIFSTCVASNLSSQIEYIDRVIDVARWSEEHGYKGMLVYTDNSLIDPWLVSQIILQNTNVLCPLVAVQPVYMHPYSVAKIISSLGYLHRRRIYLNMVAGGFKNDLLALNDTTQHDRRYDRVREYTLIIKQLLAAETPVTFEGEFYKVLNLKLTPKLPPELFPGIFVSGSSDAGVATAQALGAVAIEYPKPSAEYENSSVPTGVDRGIRIGILARERKDAAWSLAHKRFPPDRKGELTHQLAMKTSDSSWHKQLATEDYENADSPYWLVPFKSYKTFCPYLVGSYDDVADEVARYLLAGYRSFILDVPPDRDELRHTHIVFERALSRVPQ